MSQPVCLRNPPTCDGVSGLTFRHSPSSTSLNQPGTVWTVSIPPLIPSPGAGERGGGGGGGGRGCTAQGGAEEKRPGKKVPILGRCWRPGRPTRSIVANLAPKMLPKWSPKCSQKLHKKGVCSKTRKSKFGQLFTTLEPCQPPPKRHLFYYCW